MASRGKPQSDVKTLLGSSWTKKSELLVNVGVSKCLALPSNLYVSVQAPQKCRRLVTRRRLCKRDKNNRDCFVFCHVVVYAGHALLIAIVYKNAHQRMRSPNNYFTFNMACADVLLTVYAVPVSIVDTAYSHQWLITGVAGELLCRLSLTVFYYRIYFVVFFLTLMRRNRRDKFQAHTRTCWMLSMVKVKFQAS